MGVLNRIAGGDSFWRDMQYGLRMMRRNPGFTTVAVITLALGIGANSAIFSLVTAVLLRPLPVPHPEQIVSVSVMGKNDSIQAFSYPNYVDFRDRNEVLSGLTIYRFAPVSLSRGGANERIWGYEVSGNYFDVLGVKPIRGRWFSPEEDRTLNSHPVAVVSYGCWQRRFGGDPELAGKDIILNGHTFKVIGISPEGFRGTEIIYTPDIWVPIHMLGWIEPGAGWLDSRRSENMFAVGRLKQGVTVKQAEASLNVLAQQLGKQYPDDNEGQIIEVIPPGLVIPSLRGAVVSFSLVLMGAVGLVLLIACTNLAGLLLARGAERRREIAIRLAMGAGRWRLVRQLLTESILLSLAGGAGGVLLAFWILNLVSAFRPPLDFPLSFALAMDWRVLVFSLGASLVTGVVFGLIPSLQATKPDLVPALKDSTSQAGLRSSRLRSGLVVAQVALSLVLLVAAGLVVRALQHLQTMNPGFVIRNGLMASVDLGLQGYDQARGQQFYKQIVERVRSLPGVQSATIADYVPLSLNYSSNNVYVEGQPAERGANVPTSMVGTVSVNYLATMGVPLLSGREFNEEDTEKSTPVLMVNETFARRFFPGVNPAANAIGKHVRFNTTPESRYWQIVGVVGDGKYWNIGEAPRMFTYFAMAQSYSPSATLLVRTATDPKELMAAVRNQVRELDANLPVYDVKTMEEHMSFALFPARIAASMLSGFGVLAMMLAAIGIYGVTAYSVAQRTREVGVRMALGAQPSDVLRLMLRQGTLLSLIGVVIGLGGAFALTPLMSSVLYGLNATDPMTFSIVSLLLAGAALLACYVPARRATKIDPMAALRYE